MEKQTFARKSEEWLKSIKGNVKDTSYSTYYRIIQKHVIPVLGEMEANEEALEVFERYLDSQKHYSERNKASLMRVVVRIVKYGEDDCYIFKYTEDKCQFNVIEAETFTKLREHVKSNPKDPVNLGIFCGMFLGLKIGEICGLKWSDVDLIHNRITIKRNVQRMLAKKGKSTKTTVQEVHVKPRTIPIPTKVLRILLSNAKYGNYYILTGSDKPMEPRMLQYRLKAIATDIDIQQKVTFSMIRDTFAVNAIQQGVNIVALAEIMGITFNEIERYLYYIRKVIDLEGEIEKIK